MISMTSSITVIIGAENIIHLVIETIVSTDKWGKASYVFIVERIPLYSDGVSETENEPNRTRAGPLRLGSDL